MRTKWITLILVILVVLSPWGINALLKRSNLFKSTFVFNELKNKTLDYVIIGSSRGLTTLNSNLIDSLTGLSGFNASTDGGGIATNVLMLQHLIHNKVKFKYCIFTLDEIGIADNTYQFSKNTYRFVPFCQESYVQETMNKFEDCKEKFKFRASRFYPGFTVFENNKTLLTGAVKALINPKSRNRYDEKGNYTYPLGMPIDKNINFDTTEFSLYGKVYYDLLKICVDNNIKLVTYIAPIEGQFLKVPDIKNLINHSDLLNNSKFFADELHVNPIGRQIATTAFANIFVKNIK
jgi:hypothetical protein